MVKIYTRLLAIVFTFSLTWLAQDSAIAQAPEFYNNFGGTSTNSFPLNSTTSNKVQWIYAPGTLNSNGATGNPAYAGLITKVYFKVNTANPSSVYSDFTISLGQVFGTTNTFSPTAGAYNFLTGLTQCFYASTYSLTGVTAGNWYGVELDTPFQYDPNLSLIFEMKVSSGTGNSVGQLTTTGLNQRVWGGYASTSGSTGTALVDFGVDLTYSPVPNNAGIYDLPSISEGFCADTVPVTAKIVNAGNNVIDSVFVDWTVNGTPQSGQWLHLGLDTFGSGNNDTIVEIGSYYFAVGNMYTVKAWTTMPNNENDTVNGNDTTTITAGPAMAGTYVIGSSVNADFPSFTAASAALDQLGVCDHVVFEAESDTYTEQFVVNNVEGAGEDRTITFRSQTLDSSDVMVTFAGTSGQSSVILLNSASWIRFEHISINNTATTYDHGINISGASSDIEVRNCHFFGSYNSTSSNASLLVSTGTVNDNILVENNRFEGSSFGVYLYGGGTTTLESGTRIIANEFADQYYHALRLYYQNAPIVRHNKIHSTSTYTTGAGMYLVYCDNSTEVSGNHIYTDSSSSSAWPYYGIYYSTNDGTGINNTGRIFNNRIVIGYDTSVTSTSIFYGIYMTGSNAQRIVNNTVTIMSGGTSARALYQTTSDLIFFRNNLFTNHSNGYAAYFNSGISVDIDRNNYYAPNGTEIYYQGSVYNVETFTAATGYDSNSYSYNPMWSQIYNGFLCNDSLDGVASSIGYVSTDYSGFPRNGSHPDPGAVEFVGVNNFTLGADDTICGSQHSIEISGATENLFWLVDGNASGNAELILDNSTSAPKTYDVTVSFSSAHGCGNALDNAFITLVPNAQLDSNVHMCVGETEVLSAGGGTQATYMWSPTGETTESINIELQGLYSVTKTELGCVSESSAIVTQSQGVSLSDVEVCQLNMPYVGDATIQNGLSYAWDGGLSPGAAENTFTDLGTYNVTATDAFGCTSSAGFQLAVINVPTANISHVHYGNLYLFSSETSFDVGTNGVYNWSFGDGNVSQDANPQHAYPWSGSLTQYTVTLNIANACGVHQSSTIVGVDPLGLSEVSSAAFQVYPNPMKDVVNISTLDNVGATTISLSDISGRTVMNYATASFTSTVLDISTLAKGSYVLNIQTKSESYKQVLVKE